MYAGWMHIAAGYDLPVIGVALTMCALGAFATTALGRLAAVVGRARRAPWLALAIFAATCAIWSSAVLVVLAVKAPTLFAFDAQRLGIAFLAGLVLVAIAARVTIAGRLARVPAVGGALCGAAVVVVRELVMQSTRIAGTIEWNAVAILGALVVGIACTAPTAVLWRKGRSRNTTGPVALFVAAVCGSHLLATYGATIVPDARIALSDRALGSAHAGEIVVLIAMVLIGMTLVAQMLHRRDRIHRAIQRDQFRQLADVAVEGLVICEGTRIAWINRSLEELVPGVRARHVGQSLDTLIQSAELSLLPMDREIEARLRTNAPEGTSSIPVRIIKRAIRMSNRPHLVIAVRDQRERLHAEAEMARLANTDSLTGLANRARFNAMLAAIVARKPSEFPDGGGFALLAFDLDGFKSVNDSHGHAAGDAVLVEVAQRLTALVRSADLVARLGGDEFAIVVMTEGGGDGIPSLATRAIDAIARPFVVEGRFHQIGVSVGVARARRDGDDAESLTRNADLALYCAKAEGRGTYRLFEERMRVASQERHRLEQALRAAVASDQFRLHYQPQVDARTGRYNGAEALLRWMHPVGGLVQPSAFIELAEETNLIVEIGAWVIRAACLEAARWPDDLTVGVNLSPVQLNDPTLVATVASALATAEMPGRRLELEITESVLIAEGATVRATLDGLKALGVRLALDDFGTGYSSLGHLHRFPFDKIKIDRSFIARVPADPGSVAIVRAVVALGAGLGMRTSAEGVEEEEQRRFVVQAGCDQLQGFLISRPVEPSDLPRAFSDESPGPDALRATTVDRSRAPAVDGTRRRVDDVLNPAPATAVLPIANAGVDVGPPNP